MIILSDLRGRRSGGDDPASLDDCADQMECHGGWPGPAGDEPTTSSCEQGQDPLVTSAYPAPLAYIVGHRWFGRGCRRSVSEDRLPAFSQRTSGPVSAIG